MPNKREGLWGDGRSCNTLQPSLSLEKKRFFCVPNTDHEVCVNLWERSADIAALDWLFHLLLRR